MIRSSLAVLGQLPLLGTRHGSAPERAVRRVLAELARADAADDARTGRTRPPSTWTVDELLPTTSAVAVATLHDRDRGAVLKIALDDRAGQPLRAQQDVLARLHADPRLGSFRCLLPSQLAQGQCAGRPYVLEGRLPGLQGRLRGPGLPALTARAMATIAQLHSRSAATVQIDDALLARWVDGPAEVLADAAAQRRWADHRESVDRLRSMLRTGLAGRTVRVGWIHGDFWPGNVLLDRDGTITGMIDWGQADDRHLAVVDVGLWLLCVDAAAAHRQLGIRLRARLAGQCWSDDERAYLRAAQDGQDPLDEREVLLLCWLSHVAGNLRKSPAYRASRIWMTRNVRPVLKQVLDG